MIKTTMNNMRINGLGSFDYDYMLSSMVLLLVAKE